VIAAETVFYFGLCFDRTLVAAVMIKGEAEIAQLSAPVLLVDFKFCMSPFRGCLPYAMFVNRRAWKQAASGEVCDLMHRFNASV
jgi:hypothetical protein